MPRPEIAFASACGVRKRAVLAPYHATNRDEPWRTACGLPLDASSAKPLGAGDWTCQHRACVKALAEPDGSERDFTIADEHEGGQW